MRIAICDDELVYLEYLNKVIDKHASKFKEDFEVKTFHSAEEMLFVLNDTVPFDLVILDIQMGNINGMELAKRIREMDEHVFIVFLTGASDYVFDGYEVGALRYLLKPLKEEDLSKILIDIKSKLAIKKTNYLIVDINRESMKINLDDIIYFEAMGHYIIIHTDKSQYEIKSSMNELEKELDSNFFIRVHRSYIVNIKHVEKINKENCILTKNHVINISRRNYQKLNEIFIDYYRSIQTW